MSFSEAMRRSQDAGTPAYVQLAHLRRALSHYAFATGQSYEGTTARFFSAASFGEMHPQSPEPLQVAFLHDALRHERSRYLRKLQSLEERRRTAKRAGKGRRPTAIEQRLFIAPDYVMYGDRLARIRVGGHFGFLEPSGGLAIAPRFTNTRGFSEGRAPAQADGGLWGVIATDGSWVVSPRFLRVSSFLGGRASVWLHPNGPASCIDRDGNPTPG